MRAHACSTDTDQHIELDELELAADSVFATETKGAIPRNKCSVLVLTTAQLDMQWRHALIRIVPFARAFL